MQNAGMTHLGGEGAAITVCERLCQQAVVPHLCVRSPKSFSNYSQPFLSRMRCSPCHQLPRSVQDAGHARIVDSWQKRRCHCGSLQGTCRLPCARPQACKGKPGARM